VDKERGILGYTEASLSFFLNVMDDDNIEFRKAVKKQLKGKNLVCWCPLDKSCHADILLKIANEL